MQRLLVTLGLLIWSAGMVRPVNAPLASSVLFAWQQQVPPTQGGGKSADKGATGKSTTGKSTSTKSASKAQAEPNNLDASVPDPQDTQPKANRQATAGSTRPDDTERGTPIAKPDGELVRNEIGQFKLVQQRMVFATAAGEQWTVLENSTLERVERIVSKLGAGAQGRNWQVRGRLTAYKSTNYLLLEAAMLAPPLPPSRQPTPKTKPTQNSTRNPIFPELPNQTTPAKPTSPTPSGQKNG